MTVADLIAEPMAITLGAILVALLIALFAKDVYLD